MSYKAGVGDIRESPALKIIQLLRKSGADVRYHDPHVPELVEHDLRSVPLDDLDVDLVVIVTAHPSVDHEAVVERAPAVLDLRGTTRHLGAHAALSRVSPPANCGWVGRQECRFGGPWRFMHHTWCTGANDPRAADPASLNARCKRCAARGDDGGRKPVPRRGQRPFAGVARSPERRDAVGRGGTSPGG